MSKNLRIRVQPVLKGTWDSSIPYTPMDVVSTDKGSYYWCLKENTGKNPDDDKDKEFWLEVGSDLSLLNQAKEQGQISNPVYVGAVDADTLTETGVYYADIQTNQAENHWPYTTSISKALVYVWNIDGIIMQKIQSSIFEYFRAKRTTSFTGWNPRVIGVSGERKIYLSKNGDDKNSGFEPDYPVKTIGRAITLASGINFQNPNSYVTFYFGAGDWGDITFESLPYTFTIAPYDGSAPSDYSEELPKFGTLTFNNCNTVLIGTYIKYIIGKNTYIESLNGFRAFGGFEMSMGSILRLGSGTIGVIQAPSGRTNFMDITQSLASIGSLTLKLLENVTLSRFYQIRFNACLRILTDITYNFNGYTFTGQKFGFVDSCLINTYTSPESLANQVWGEGYVVNGAVWQGLPDKAVAKSGDTMTGRLTLSTNPSILPCMFVFQNIIDDITSLPTNIQRYSIIDCTDKNGQPVTSMYSTRDTSGLNQFHLNLYIKNKIYKALLFNHNYDGSTTLDIGSNPPTSSNNTLVPTTAWVNQKLGSGTKAASLASTLSLMAMPETEDSDNVELTSEQTLNDKKSQVISQINSEVQQAIYSKFPYEINNKEYLFGTSLFDQQNLNDLVTLSMLNPQDKYQIICTDTDTGLDSPLEVSASQLQEIYKFIVNTKQSILLDANEKKNKILKASTKEEVDKIYNS